MFELSWLLSWQLSSFLLNRVVTQSSHLFEAVITVSLLLLGPPTTSESGVKVPSPSTSCHSPPRIPSSVLMTAVCETLVQSNPQDTQMNEELVVQLQSLPIAIRRSRSESYLSLRIRESGFYSRGVITPKEAFRIWGVVLETTCD